MLSARRAGSSRAAPRTQGNRQTGRAAFPQLHNSCFDLSRVFTSKAISQTHDRLRVAPHSIHMQDQAAPLPVASKATSSLEFEFGGWTPPNFFPSDATATPAIVRMNIGARKQIRHSTGKILRFADAAPTRTSLARVIYQLALTWGGWVASRDSALKKKRELRGRMADTGNSRTDVVLATGHRHPLWILSTLRSWTETNTQSY